MRTVLADKFRPILIWLAHVLETLRVPIITQISLYLLMKRLDATFIWPPFRRIPLRQQVAML